MCVHICVCNRTGVNDNRKILFLSRAALIFGGITVLAGLMGTVFGSGMSKFLSRWTRKSDALVCSVSMLLGGPFLFLALLLARYELYAAWVSEPFRVFRFSSIYCHLLTTSCHS